MTIGQIASSQIYGTEAIQSGKIRSEKSMFENLLSEIKSEKYEGAGKNISSSQIVEKGHINGDWNRGFSGTYTAESDKNSLPQGAAANSAIKYGIGLIFVFLQKKQINGVKVKMTMSFDVKTVKNAVNK